MKIGIIEQTTSSGKTTHYPITDESGKLIPFTKVADAVRYIQQNYGSDCEFYMLKEHITVEELTNEWARIV